MPDAYSYIHTQHMGDPHVPPRRRLTSHADFLEHMRQQMLKEYGYIEPEPPEPELNKDKERRLDLDL